VSVMVTLRAGSIVGFMVGSGSVTRRHICVCTLMCTQMSSQFQNGPWIKDVVFSPLEDNVSLLLLSFGSFSQSFPDTVHVYLMLWSRNPRLRPWGCNTL
jgi:hypothetical protein